MVGALTYANGDKYEGYWFNNEQHERGSYTWASGNRYDGDWEDGNPTGFGTLTYANGDEFEDHWTICFERVNYEGEKKDSLRHGKGIQLFSNNSKYEGQWKDDNRNGQGIWTTLTAIVMRGNGKTTR